MPCKQTLHGHLGILQHGDKSCFPHVYSGENQVHLLGTQCCSPGSGHGLILSLNLPPCCVTSSGLVQVLFSEHEKLIILCGA